MEGQSPSPGEELRREQVRMHGANLPFAVAGSALAAGATAWLSHWGAPRGAATTWLAVMGVLYAALIVMGWAYRRTSQSLSSKAWLSLFRGSVLVHGLAWGGGAAILMVLPQNLALQFFVGMVVVGVAASGQTMVVLDALSAWLFVTPVLLPCAFALLLQGDPLSAGAAALMLAYTAMLALNARLAYRRALEHFRLMRSDRALVAQLRRSKEAAESANRAKTGFLSNMSHELRTPLNAILGFGQLLLADDDQVFPPKQRRWVGSIVDSGRHLLELVDNVLDYAAFEAGDLKINLAPIDARAAVEASVWQVTQMSGTRPLRIQIGVVPEPACWVKGDATRLQQVLLNLLTNAIKFNRPDGGVYVDFQDEGDHLRISIADEGAGLAADEVPRLFKAFERFGADKRGIPGTGIGLALSRQLILAMGGEIGASTEVGRGSVFWLRLPKH